MSRLSISLTEPNAKWIKSLLESKEYTSTSDAINDLIRQARREESQHIDKVRSLLIEAEESLSRHGYSKLSVNDIWEIAKQRHTKNDD
ncbi:CopG family transcriptional regulator [Maribrevibacterium harenarium]|uniref:CopG family transcriptional regulator n=1 Tax=Maribrevibacterium harenarium TaxID=2589817 RepID=A0A501WKL6_9GAMM|nr:CopG family transcriptional regulator [Maribrevibacterium harenarium]TPE50333.1 CopG family transcriptional regulator [Maribrevibacterium harenarium]